MIVIPQLRVKRIDDKVLDGLHDDVPYEEGPPGHHHRPEDPLDGRPGREDVLEAADGKPAAEPRHEGGGHRL